MMLMMKENKNNNEQINRKWKERKEKENKWGGKRREKTPKE
jgi:hypothetical protein